MHDAEYDVVAIGRPYTDIQVEVTDELLKKYGFAKGRAHEITSDAMELLRYGRFRQDGLRPSSTAAGGSPPNTCADVQALGGKAAFIGKVCHDDSGRIFRDEFWQTDVYFPTGNYTGIQPHVSGTCLVLTTPGDKDPTYVHCKGVGDILAVDDIPADLIQNSKILFFQAHFLFEPTSRLAILKAMKIAKEADREIFVSFQDHRFTKAQVDYFHTFYWPDITGAFGNSSEYKAALPNFDLAAAADGNRLMSRTNGEKGADIAGRSELHYIPTFFKGAMPYPNGAGDGSAAGILYGLAKGLPIQSCGELGAEVASAILAIPGARPVGSLQHIADKYLKIGGVTPRRNYEKPAPQ